MHRRMIRPLESPRGKYKFGDKVELENIEVGDHIRFSTPNQEPKTGTVARILPLKDNHLRKVAFLDDNNYVLNSFPDSGTDAVFAASPEVEDRLERLEQAKQTKKMRKFSKNPPGTIYNQEMVGGPDWLYIKVGENNWTLVAQHKGGSYDVQQSLSDELVFESISDESKTGKIILPNCLVRGKR